MEAKTVLLFITVIIVAVLNYCVAQTSYQEDGLIAHNSYRWWHESPRMNLDYEVTQAAQECAVYYAKKRRIDHSCKTEGTGENLYAQWGGDGNPNLNDVTKVAIKLWYEENSTYNYESPGDSTGVTGHFTQLVWKESTGLGIGAATVDGYTVVVGKYKPYGNIKFIGDDEWMFFRKNVQRPK